VVAQPETRQQENHNQGNYGSEHDTTGLIRRWWHKVERAGTWRLPASQLPVSPNLDAGCEFRESCPGTLL